MSYRKLHPKMIEWRQQLRLEALQRYKENPVICKYCGVYLIVYPKDRICHIRKKIYCSQHCFGKDSNAERVANNNRGYKPKKPKKQCLGCEKKLYPRTKGNYCIRCRADNMIAKFSQRTKKSVFEQFDGRWDCCRATITKHARKMYLRSDREKYCIVCKYDKHFEVCHIKSVEEFEDTATIAEINALTNVISLCPNHHWEFDNGLLNKEELVAGVGTAPTTGPST